MKIFGALGLGLALVILKSIMPDVMSGFEGTLVSFFGITQSVLANVQSAIPH